MASVNIASILEKRIKEKLDTFSEDNIQLVLEKTLDKMDEVKNRESSRGKSPAKGGRWDNTYSDQYAKRDKNGRRSPVDLRNQKRGIENTTQNSPQKGRRQLLFNGQSESRRGGQVIQVDTGKIMKFHQDGANGKRRQIYPETQAQLPDEVRKVLIEGFRKIWQGQ